MQYYSGQKAFRKLLWRILLPNNFGDGAQLHVAGSLIDGSNLAVTVEFFLREILGESNSAHPIDAFHSHFLCHLRGEILGHCSFLQEWYSSFL